MNIILQRGILHRIAPFFRKSLVVTASLICLAQTGGRFEAKGEIFEFPDGLREVSGMAESRMNPGVFWAHQDSGDDPRAYAVNRKGKRVGTFLLKGAANRDWEDMAIGPGPGAGDYLYFADIGDNNNRRASVTIYRVAEPSLRKPQRREQKLSGVVAFEFQYDDGPRDAEGFFVDPLSGDFYVVTKRELDGNRLYRGRKPRANAMNKFERVATLKFLFTTGAAISRDGTQILVRRYSAGNPLLPAATAAMYWRRANGQTSIESVMAQTGQLVALAPEPQGEAIAFAIAGNGFYTTTERGETKSAPVTFYAPK